MQSQNSDRLEGELIGGRYRIVELVGRGGGSLVYRARDESLPRDVAIKIMQPSAADPEALARQRSEIDTLAALNHHGLVTLIDAGGEHTESGERAFLVMEYVSGPTLRELTERGPLAPAFAGHLGADVSEALHYVHGQGLVHRDIKPGNVLLVPSDLPGREFTAKLADFGIARLIDGSHLTATGMILGTARYLSPEQASGAAVGTASDIYSLGLVLLEALTGERAFPGPTAESIVARLHSSPDIPQELPTEWRELLTHMTSRSPDERPTALELASHMRGLGAGLPTVPLDVSDPGLGESTQRMDAVTSATLPTRQFAQAPLTSIHSAPALTTTTPATPATADPRPEAATTALATESTEPEQRGGARLIVGALIVMALIAGGVAWAIGANQPASQPQPTTSYPPVPGELGRHLEQLQESVTP